MANPITEFTQAIRTKLIDDSSFSSVFGSRYYLYSVPDDWSFPYVTSFSVGSNSWMTIGNVSSGEEFLYPFYAHGKSPSNLRDGTLAISDALHLLDSLSMSNYNLIYSRRILWNKPQETNEEEMTYVQMIQFRFMIQKN